MISFNEEASLAELSVHRIGNKSADEDNILSDNSMVIQDEFLDHLLKQFFLAPFEKVNEIYHFFHTTSDLSLNEIYRFASEIFDNSHAFHEQSKKIAEYLYEVSGDPRIKPGELYLAYFENVQIEGELHEAVGIFKSEIKDTYLKVSPEKSGFRLSYEQEAVNINKLDKGCLIFNADKADGYRVAVIDLTNRSTAAGYWKDEFLKLRVRNDTFNQTRNVLGVYKNFVSERLDQEFDISKADKIDLLNKSMKYFREKENFDLEEFSNEVIGSPEGIVSFLDYKKKCETESDAPISDSFNISDEAVKKLARVYKSVLKLDRNFHIYIHGDKELIEKGFDDDKSMNYYKVFFREEQ